MIKNVNLKNDKYIANLITEELKKSDVIDMFNFKYISNKIYLQGLAKCRKYDEEKYPYKIGYYKI